MKQATISKDKADALCGGDRKGCGQFSAYVPDLPGCIATGVSVEAVESELRDAIRFHIEGLKEDGLPIPDSTSIADCVEA